MNPIYRFIIKQKTSNLIDPYSCYQISEGMMGTGLMKVESGETYVLTLKDKIIPMQNIFLYDINKTLVWFTFESQNEIQIPDNVVYLETIFPLGINPIDMGVFKTPFTQFESYYYGTVNPLYRDDLNIDYALETNQEFYRGKLSGKLTFQGADFLFIRQQAFDQQFDLDILISYDNGIVWTKYWAGQFWKTDCQFNEDDKTAIVTPNVNDAYNAVLAGMEKEFNLIELAPEIIPVKADKRSLIQVYVPGQRVIGCFLSNMWWEQECEPINNESDLVNHYRFQRNIGREIAVVSGNMNPKLPLSFNGAIPTRPSSGYYSYFFDNDGYRLEFEYDESAGYQYIKWTIYRLEDYVALWSYESTPGYPPEPSIPYSVSLQPITGSGATGSVTLQLYDISIYARRVHNVRNTGYNIPNDDLVENNRNYTKVSPVDVSNQLIVSSKLQSTPTEWGIYQPGLYYVMPYNAIFGPARCYPIARSMWSEISFWFAVSQTDWQTEPAWRTEFEIKDCFPIYSVISVLLGKVAPGIKHQGTTTYSSFLYGGQPLQIPDQRVFITPKSNIVTAGYDQPAQKAPITLKLVLDMLRDCFRCYWFIDSQNRFRIEHIEYFRRGGTYTGNPIIGTDLTQQIVTRNGKPWAFVQNEYQYDKPDMAAWYQFGWMDNATELFKGLPMEIISKYVNPDKIESIEIAQFSSDVDFMLLTPGDVSQDGFALLCPVPINGGYKLPYFTFTVNHVDYVLQNAYAAFAYLQLHYRWDMPAKLYTRNGEQETAKGIKKLKNQNVSFPALYDPEMVQLIKTQLGNGTIQKISINLSSRNAKATLKYDTE